MLLNFTDRSAFKVVMSPYFYYYYYYVLLGMSFSFEWSGVEFGLHYFVVIYRDVKGTENGIAALSCPLFLIINGHNKIIKRDQVFPRSEETQCRV
jgi:hypothetical protein